MSTLPACRPSARPAALLGAAVLVVMASRAPGAPPASDAAAARRAFLAAYPVLVHPRCQNCHPVGDRPLQGDAGAPHALRVKRGPEGLGQYAVRCFACHQTKNLPGEHMPPGAPNWHLPPPSMRMVFEGMTAAELCRQLKDPKRNGGKTLAQIAAHSSHDPLVGWGWSPGPGRTPAPGTWKEFGARMTEWAEKGAACPE